MITNLPETIEADIVSNFDIGEVEALDDNLLWDCYCDTFPIKEYLKGKKDILLGNKGSGKTAVFRLLKEKKINFYNEQNFKQIVVSIDESVEYLSISSKLHEVMETSIESEDTKYRFLWEVYILYRIAIVIVKEHEIKDTELSSRLALLTEFFRTTTSKPTILEFLSSSKKTAGFKLDYTNPALPMPDFYISSEPADKKNKNKDIDPRTINIDEIKTLLNNCLRKNKSAVYVLIDHVDDFIAREEYSIQKKILQGLLTCSKSYSRHSLIKVKLFLREDLFHKLNFSEVGGYDKVSPRTISLQWSNSDIRRFIAERILNNLSKTLKTNKNFAFTISQESLVLKRKSYRRKNILEKVLHKIGIEDINTLLKRDNRDAWDVTEMDQVWRDSITSVLPRAVNHFNLNGSIEAEEDIFDYLEDHFCLANGSATPRIMILFLEKLISLSSAYYRDKPGEKIHLDHNGEYPLFKRDHIVEAYGELQNTMLKMFISCVTNETWRKALHTFLSNRGKKTSFSFRTIMNSTGLDENTDMREFLAFLEHLGVLYCTNRSLKLVQRRYDIPIILQKNWVLENAGR